MTIKITRQDIEEDLPLFPDAQVNQIPFLQPDTQSGERWLTLADLQKLEASISASAITIAVDELSIYRYQCRSEIVTKRRYQIPAQGHAEILASEKLQRSLKLKSLRFVQEGAVAPGAFIRFTFINGLISIAKITVEMIGIGFHEYCQTQALRILIDAVILAYYRDLVVPGETRISQQTNRQQGVGQQHSATAQRWRYSLPRTQYAPNSPLTLREWHCAQDRARHLVVGHMRWIRREFVADAERQELARIATGRILPPGYTWVMAHERGTSAKDLIEVRVSDLTGRALFAAPARAAQELAQMIGT